MVDKILVLVFSVVILSWSSSVFADEQVHFDLEKKVLIYTESMEKDIRYFQDYSGLKEAKLFKDNVSNYIIELNYVSNHSSYQDRKNFTIDELSRLRAGIKGYTAKQNQAMDDGKFLFLSSTLGNSFYYGFTLASIIQEYQPEFTWMHYFGTELLFGGLGFFVPFAFTYNKHISKSAAGFYALGSYNGLMQGFAIDLMLNSSSSVKPLYVNLVIPGALNLCESIIGYNIGDRLNMDSGSIGMMSLGINYTTMMALGFSILFDWNKSSGDVGAALLTGNIAGQFVGYWMGVQDHYTDGDLNMIVSLTGLAAYTSLAVATYAAESTKSTSLIMMLGSTAGLGCGMLLMKDKDFEIDRGYIGLAPYAGMAVGAGLWFLNPEDGRAFGLYTSIGGLLGYGIMYMSFEKAAHEKALENQKSALSFRLSPEVLAMALMPDKDKMLPVANSRIAELRYEF